MSGPRLIEGWRSREEKFERSSARVSVIERFRWARRDAKGRFVGDGFASSREGRRLNQVGFYARTRDVRTQYQRDYYREHRAQRARYHAEWYQRKRAEEAQAVSAALALTGVDASMLNTANEAPS